MNLLDTQSGTEAELEHDSVSALRAVRYLAVLLALGVVLSVAVVGAAAGANTDGPVTEGVVVDLNEEGNAVVTVTVSFDLTVEDERSDFEAFVESETKQQAQLDQYESRLSNVAAELESQTGREMAVRNASISTQTGSDGERGLVLLQATWEGLAADNGDQLVLGEPFDSGFTADQTVAVRPPKQHRVVSTAPDPTREGEQLRWSDDQSLNGFEVVIEPLDGTADGDSSDGTTPGGGDSASVDGQTATDGDDGSGPGFGIAVALLGVAGLGLLARRR